MKEELRDFLIESTNYFLTVFVDSYFHYEFSIFLFVYLCRRI